MSESVVAAIVVAVVAAIPSTISAYAALRSSKRNAAALEANAVKLDQVHKLTDGNLTTVKDALAEALREIKRLQRNVDHN